MPSVSNHEFNASRPQKDDSLAASDRRLQAELAAVHALHAAVGEINPRPPGLHNEAIQFAKRAIRRVLTWYTRPLHAFHAAVARALQEDVRNTQALYARCMRRLDALESALQLQAHLYATDGVGDREQIAFMLEQNLPDRLTTLERRMRHVLQPLESTDCASRPRRVGATGAEALPLIPSTFDYYHFQERYRGSEQEIKTRQEAYVPYFHGCSNVVDLGCGRGEFVELLLAAGVDACGIESDTDALLRCREKKIPVVDQELFAWLQGQADGSLGGIFSAQVIEHLPVERQLGLVRLAGDKLKPGAPLVVETINPECIFALARNFYLDPTHVRPVHPELLMFVMESSGFQNVRIIYSSPVPGRGLSPASREGLDENTFASLEQMNRLLFGFQDYAAVARREPLSS
jgi:2-polyprenyl-3-methyl-5-hydroxy-6-metoxy-1,4-benzoquinol methylase